MALKIMKARIFHQRHVVKKNVFTYHAYYIAMPIQPENKIPSRWYCGINKPGLISFYNKDHGARTDSCLFTWLTSLYRKQDVTLDKHTVLVTMPRVLGYVFNPVSFWLTFNQHKQLTSVLCEVNNTYSESHSYLCAAENNEDAISSKQWFTMKKQFHVSPFFKREGYYKLNFNVINNIIKIIINYYDADEQLALTTSVQGALKPINATSVLCLFLSIPLMTLKVICLIYYQAIKLKLKGIKFRNKPEKLSTSISCNKNITKS